MMEHIEWQQGEFVISTDRARLDIAAIHCYLSERSYWAQGRSRAAVERSIEHSLCFGIYYNNAQAGFARLLTDYCTVAYLADVFVLEDYRGRGLGKWLMACVLAHPALQAMPKWVLHTLDAHTLYSQYGFAAPAHPEWIMEYRPQSS
ncbi:MAG: GNAT family N-acetyltransferase [Chloroflexaceae bacterium]|nr:GNAT family N-acetyltransferase [Chloroflexaceae bacterium]NJL33062.1 GNAT family N-acetyltransferase [Chloroflexaceae bacterium]NJO04929.1 GNAT family N-acetyltransferase [Chloroflexaceae bacterium]